MEKLYIVIPCYNEEEVLDETCKRLNIKMNSLIKFEKISKDSKIVLINDGSQDKTWDLIKKQHKANNLFYGINLTRNRGHQNAVMAGLLTVKDEADFVISMDADLQDDINTIDEMIDEYYQGNDIVYGVRSSRKKDSFFKRKTALFFYKLMRVMGVDIVYNHADYRLMSKRAIEGLEKFEEVNLFLRGIVPLIGYKSSKVMYERNERFAGVTKYPFKKMFNFAIDGITSFSVKPIRMIFVIGSIVTLLSIGFLIYSLTYCITNQFIPSWTYITFSIWFIGGLQLLALGIVAEYISKIYLETKKRPRYIIGEYLNGKE